MSILKVIIIVVISGIALFILLLYIALSPTIRNVSSHKALKIFLDKPLKIERQGYLFNCKEGSYGDQRFRDFVLSESEVHGSCNVLLAIPAGSTITITQFKTYKGGTSGFTSLYALGECTNANGEKVEFEYDWGGTDLAKLAGKQPTLPIAIWQRSEDSPVLFK